MGNTTALKLEGVTPEQQTKCRMGVLNYYDYYEFYNYQTISFSLASKNKINWLVVLAWSRDLVQECKNNTALQTNVMIIMIRVTRYFEIGYNQQCFYWSITKKQDNLAQEQFCCLWPSYQHETNVSGCLRRRLVSYWFWRAHNFKFCISMLAHAVSVALHTSSSNFRRTWCDILLLHTV